MPLTIVSYREKRTRDFAEGKPVKAFDAIHRQGELKLDERDAATPIRDFSGTSEERGECVLTLRKPAVQ